MTYKVAAISVFVSLMLVQAGYSQKGPSTDYYTALKKADLSKLWFNDISLPENDSTSAALPEPLGFIGNHYQRFYIHFISVKKSKVNPYQYIVTGKTKVKESVCTFRGIINVVKAGIFEELFEEEYKQGFVDCNIIFYEDSLQSSTGFFKGKLTSKFYLDKSNRLWYNDLEIGADGYSNNQCEAIWTSYATRISKPCNWGDYRIPQSKALDSGDGEFSVDKKYDAFGWKNYRIAWSGDPWKEGTSQARENENILWWDK